MSSDNYYQFEIKNGQSHWFGVNRPKNPKRGDTWNGRIFNGDGWYRV